MTKKQICSLTFLLLTSPTYSYKYYASDVIRYALTSHGITYLLRDKKGAVNAWKTEPEKALKVKRKSNGNIPIKRWGNTDCSGLSGSALRIHKYYPTESRRKSAPGTWHNHDYARTGKRGLFYVKTSKKTVREKIQHGDMFNRTGRPYGHVFFFNGVRDDLGVVSTVEARSGRYGVGLFYKRSWNSIFSEKYKLIRSKHVYNDVKGLNKVLTLAEADSTNNVFSKEKTYKTKKKFGTQSAAKKPSKNSAAQSTQETYKVRSGDRGEKIAKKHGISFKKLVKLNPGINWRRIYPGQILVVGDTQAVASKPKKKKKSNSTTVTYRVKRGDYLSKIAKKYRVSVKTIRKLNPAIKRNNIIHPGQTLIISK